MACSSVSAVGCAVGSTVGCAVGSTNIDLFAKMTGIKFHVEGPVGQFALGRPAKPDVSELEHVVLR